MLSSDSVTVWIHQLRDGDPAAAQKLWEGYFHRLVGLARAKLQAIPRRATDEEDVALSAFNSFCCAVGQGRFPRLEDRDDLWQVLFVITDRKAKDTIQHETRGKRDYRRQQAAAATSDASPLAGLAGREPDPAFAAEVAEECQRLLGLLANETHRKVALDKMQGHTNEEIAATMKVSVPTIERQLRLIRREWEENGISA